MTITKAILLGILFCFCRMGILYTWPKNSPIFGALCIGIVLGDVPKAMIIGAAIQAIYMGVIQPGGNIPTDQMLATFIAIPIAIQNKLAPEVAVSLAVPVGLLGLVIDYIRRTLNAAWVHMADKYAEDCNTNGIMKAAYLYPVLLLILLYVVPVSLSVYFGPAAVDSVMKSVPAWIIQGLSVAGGLLPALGFAITIMVIGKKEIMPYFLVGFLVFRFFPDINTIGLAIFGAFFAYLHVLFTKDKLQEGGAF